MDGTLAFVEHELVAAHREDADRTPPILHARDFDDFRPVVVDLIHEIRIPKFVFRECLDICDGFTPETLREKIYLIAFYVLDSEDVEAFEERERCVVDRVAQDGFLNEQDVATALFDLFADIQQIGATLLDDLVHLPVIVDDNRVIHLQPFHHQHPFRLEQNRKPTSGLGALSWNWISPIFAFSILVGPPAATTTF